ncbi:MAG: hypothetical protein ABR887_06650 [Methanoregulaceae archaeon]|jgi:hypothetical protein
MFLLSIAMVLQEQNSDDKKYEIFLNRTGINSIEGPKPPVRVEIGGTLKLRFVNRGSPIHITISSSNSGMFSSFFHDNLYIVDETLFSIPIYPDCHEGFFDVEIIAGYGVIKVAFRIDVLHTDRFMSQKVKEPPLQPVPRGRPHPLMVMMGFSLLLYSAWLYLRLDILNTAAFFTLIIGAIYTWYRQGLQ